jgi:hypothetical protein
MSEPRLRILSPLFWAAMVFCLICFAAAAYVGLTAARPPVALGLHSRPR